MRSLSNGQGPVHETSLMAPSMRRDGAAEAVMRERCGSSLDDALPRQTVAGRLGNTSNEVTPSVKPRPRTRTEHKLGGACCASPSGGHLARLHRPDDSTRHADSHLGPANSL